MLIAIFLFTIGFSEAKILARRLSHGYAGFFEKLKIPEPFTETPFECRRGDLTIHGTRDAIVAPDYSRQAQRAYANARLHIIEGGAHGFSRKHDAIAIVHLKRFLER